MVFARWGISEKLVTDSGLQFTAGDFKHFANEYGFMHTTTSPHYPKANGEAVRAVQTAKKILTQRDSYLALLNYRSSPIAAIGHSPAQLIMGSHILSALPSSSHVLQRKWPDLEKVKHQAAETKTSYQLYHDRNNSPQGLSPLKPGDKVRVKLHGDKTWQKQQLTVVSGQTRSYVLKSPDGATHRRNRKRLQKVSNDGSSADNGPQFDYPSDDEPPGDIQTTRCTTW